MVDFWPFFDWWNSKCF